MKLKSFETLLVLPAQKSNGEKYIYTYIYQYQQSVCIILTSNKIENVCRYRNIFVLILKHDLSKQV